MNAIVDASLSDERTSANVVLAKWYASHPAVRRLWAVSESHGLRVIVTLQPTHDGDDAYPSWLANSDKWARELQSRMNQPVRLEALDGPLLAEIRAGVDEDLVAELSWRDSSTPPTDGDYDSPVRLAN